MNRESLLWLLFLSEVFTFLVFPLRKPVFELGKILRRQSISELTFHHASLLFREVKQMPLEDLIFQVTFGWKWVLHGSESDRSESDGSESLDGRESWMEVSPIEVSLMEVSLGWQWVLGWKWVGWKRVLDGSECCMAVSSWKEVSSWNYAEPSF